MSYYAIYQMAVINNQETDFLVGKIEAEDGNQAKENYLKEKVNEKNRELVKGYLGFGSMRKDQFEQDHSEIIEKNVETLGVWAGLKEAETDAS